jgi:hypothetical protein
MRSLISDEKAVSIQIGNLLNLMVLLIITGIVTSAFYLYTEEASKKALSESSTELGNQIARDITNMYLISRNSKGNVSLDLTRDIPLTLGGKSYLIELKNAKDERMASIDINEVTFSDYGVSTTLNSIDKNVSANGTVYSGSGKMNILLIKNSSGAGLWIK